MVVGPLSCLQNWHDGFSSGPLAVNGVSSHLQP